MITFSKLKISTKLITSIAFSTVLVITLISIIIAQKVQHMAEEDAKIIVREAAYHYAYIVDTELELALGQAKTIARIFESFARTGDSSASLTRAEASEMLKYVIEREESFLGVYTVFEPNAFDGRDIEFVGEVGHDNNTGRFVPYWSRNEQGKAILEPAVNYDVEGKGDYYLIPKKTGQESIIEPYIYPIHGKEFFVTSVVVPIFNKQKNFIGIVGIDLDLAKIQTLMNTFKLDEYATAFSQFYSANGMVIKHRDTSLIGKNVKESNADDPEFIAAVLGQSSVAMKRFSPLVQDVVRSFIANLPIGNTGQSWSVVVSIPEAELKQIAHALNLQIAVIGGVAILMIILIVYWMARRISNTLRSMVEISQAITTGKWDNQITVTSKDEMGQLLLAFQVMQTQLQERFDSDQRIVKEINATILTASQGDFSKRISLEDKAGTFKTIGESINSILEFNQLAIKDLTRVFSSVAKGDLTQTITNIYSGELAQLKQDANTTVQRLTEVTEEINLVTGSASQGDFTKRIGLESKAGTFKVIGESINRVLQYNQLAIKDLTRVFSSVAKGDLTQTITNIYSGELAQLKQDANTTVQRLTEVTEEINLVTGSASQGDFTKRISLESKAGTFKVIGESINRVLQYNQLAIKDLTRVFSALSQGDLTQTITNDYSGEFAQLKRDANTTVQKLTGVTDEINSVTGTALQGNFSKRVSLESKTGTFKVLSESINGVLEFNQLAIKDLTRVFSSVAKGDLTQTITNIYSGELAQLKQDANTTVQRLTEVTEEINLVTGSASQGDFSKRISLEGKTGTFKVLGESINRVLEFNQLAIKDLTRVFSSVAQGDLTQTITTDYSGELEQLKHDANSTVQKLTEILKVIQQSANVVSQAASEMSEGNDNLSQRTTEQAASLEETASSMEEMTVTVQQNAENAKQASQLAGNAKERAEQGNHVVKDAILSISEIHKSSKKITEIISVINEIAFQTNLLALNAAVEAARAGEQGRGFAVVATEVRNLAQRSAAAAKEIKELIQDSNLKVEEGTRLANQSGQALEELVVAVKKVNDIISEIAAASSEQSMGIVQVNKAITQMDEMVEQNSALVEQSMAASESMKDQAQMLKEQVAFFDMGNIGETDNSAKIKPRTSQSHSQPHLPKHKIRASHQSHQNPHSPKSHTVQNSEDSEGWKDF